MGFIARLITNRIALWTLLFNDVQLLLNIISESSKLCFKKKEKKKNYNASSYLSLGSNEPWAWLRCWTNNSKISALTSKPCRELSLCILSPFLFALFDRNWNRSLTDSCRIERTWSIEMHRSPSLHICKVPKCKYIYIELFSLSEFSDKSTN